VTKKIIIIGMMGLAILLGSAAIGISTRQAPPDSLQGQASAALDSSFEALYPEGSDASEQPGSDAAQPGVKEAGQEKNLAQDKAKEKAKKEAPKVTPAEKKKATEAIEYEEQKTALATQESQDSKADQAQWQGKLKITGSASFRSRVGEALDLLAKKAPAFAKKVDTYLTEIRESDHSGVEVQTGVFHLGKNTVNNQDSYWLASVIVHDAYHAELYQKGQDYTGKTAEARCIEEQKDVLLAMGAPDSYQVHLNQVLESNYWDVPFENRNW